MSNLFAFAIIIYFFASLVYGIYFVAMMAASEMKVKHIIGLILMPGSIISGLLALTIAAIVFILSLILESITVKMPIKRLREFLNRPIFRKKQSI